MTTPTLTKCPYCQEEIGEGCPSITCPECGETYHAQCVHIHKRCATPGCTGTVYDLIPGLVEDTAPPVVEEAPQRTAVFWLTNPWVLALGMVVILIIVGTYAVHHGAPLAKVLAIGVIIAALAFDYVNGMHDAGNAIATVISTRVLTPMAALAMAAVLNLAGAMVASGVAHSIANKFANTKGLPDDAITPLMLLCGLVGASAWSYLTAQWGLPVSTSHSLFGGLIGVFLLTGIPLNMGYLGTFFLFMVLAPLMAFSLGWVLMTIINLSLRKVAPYKMNKYFRFLQACSSAMMAFAHGSNDAQKAMGIITMALVAGKFIIVPEHADVDIPFWVKLSCAVVIALGTGFGGMRVIRTLGHKIIKLAPVHGFAAETVASATILFVTFMKVPISTTHAISSSILGIGASKRLSTVRWGVAGNIILAWLFTIPTCAVAGALLYKVVNLITHIR